MKRVQKKGGRKREAVGALWAGTQYVYVEGDLREGLPRIPPTWSAATNTAIHPTPRRSNCNKCIGWIICCPFPAQHSELYPTFEVQGDSGGTIAALIAAAVGSLGCVLVLIA